MSEANEHLGVGGRLGESPAVSLVDTAFALEAKYGPGLYHTMSLSDLAHAVVLLEAGLVPQSPGQKLLAALLELHRIPASQFNFDPAQGDPYSNRELAVRERAGTAADWLQTGRARRESSTVGYALAVRAGLLAVAEGVVAALQALINRAAQHATTLMPDYTYLQTAQPTSLGHYLLTFAQPMIRDLDRLRLAFEHTNRSPAGIGSTNGTRLALGRERLAALLGFDGLALHTRDAMWQPDGPIEVMAALTALLINIDRLAEDLQLWATAEFGYIELADRHSRISVIMPQKKNPYGLAYLRGLARDMIGRLAGTAALQATPSGQVDNRIFCYDSVPQALGHTARAVHLLAGIVADLTVKVEVLEQRAHQEHSGATDLAEAMTLASGLSPRVAHRIVGHAIRQALAAGRVLDAEMLDAAAQAIIQRPLGLMQPFVAEQMDPQAIVSTRTTSGGAAPEPVLAMIEGFGRRAADHHAWLTQQRQRIDAAEQALIQTAEELCRST